VSKSRVTAKGLIEAIHHHNGNVSAVARQYGLSRTGIHYHMNRMPTAKLALEEARETMLDEAESKLYEAVKDGKTAELLFFLRTQGRGRGYVERQEHTGADGGPIKVKGYALFDPADWDKDDDDSDG